VTSTSADASERLPQVGERVLGAGDLVAEGFGRHVVARPEGGIACPRIRDNLVTRGRGKDWIEDGAVGQMALLDRAGDGERLRLGLPPAVAHQELPAEAEEERSQPARDIRSASASIAHGDSLGKRVVQTGVP